MRGKLIATLLFSLLPAAPARADPILLSPSIVATVAKPAWSENLVCTVSQTSLPAGTNEIVVLIRVPNKSAVKSALLKTTYGDVDLELANSLPLIGEYETVIDSEKTQCATSGTLLLEVERDLETKTATCPGILLPRAAGCHE